MATPTSAKEVWCAALVSLRTANPEICRQWFDEIEPLALSAGVLTLRAPDQMRRRYLEKTTAQAFRAAAQDATGRLLTIRFVDDAIAPRQGDAATHAAPTTPEVTGRDSDISANRNNVANVTLADASATPASQPVDAHEFILNPDLVFSAFVVGPNNRLAHTAASAVAKQPGDVYNPLFVHGGVGLGKTHLLHAICHEVIARDAKRRVVFVSCEEFITRFFEYLQAQRMLDFRKAFRQADLLIVDDIHDLAGHKRIQEEFFHTFNATKERGAQIILSSDASPDEIPELEDRLISRFGAGLVTKLDSPDPDTRVAILQRKAADRGVDMPLEVAKFIARRFDDSCNIRELEGALTVAQHRAFADGADVVTLDIAEKALGVNDNRPARRIPLDLVILVVVDHYGVPLSQLQARSRRRSVALPRQVCMHLARRLTSHSLEEIGGHFGGRDHTTVLHAHRMIEGRKESDAELRTVVEHLERQVVDLARANQ